jgi:multicomponent Na+:H+ antiporter subunit B
MMNFEFGLNVIFLISVILSIVIYRISVEKNLKLLVLWSSVLSACSVLLYLIMDAPDVAMTEAALGSAITTIIFFKHTTYYEDTIAKNDDKILHLIGLGISIAFGALLVIIGQEVENYGSITAVHNNTQNYYDNMTAKEIGIPSFVAAILASYRGYDTLGETLVIFVAVVGVLVVVKQKSNSNDLPLTIS